MNKIIKQAENISLTDSDILNITNGKTNIILYEDLEDINNIDDVLGDFGAVTILFPLKTSNIGHWVCLFKVNNNTLEFFDPIGLAPDEELKFSELHTRIHKGEHIHHLTFLLNQSKYNLIYNKTKLQKNIKDVNTCGRFTAIRLIFRHLSLVKFIALFKGLDADFTVSSLTLIFSID